MKGRSLHSPHRSDVAGYVDAGDTDAQFLMLRGRRALAILACSLLPLMV